MVKPPKIRHSKPRRDPVTIDLDPSEVKRDAARKEAQAGAAPRTPDSPAKEQGSSTTAGTSAEATGPRSGSGSSAPSNDKDEKAMASKSEASGSSPAANITEADKGTGAAKADNAWPAGQSERQETNSSSTGATAPAATTAGAATSVPASGKTDAGKTSGASTASPPRPASEKKEQPAFGRSAGVGAQKSDRREPSPAPAPASRDSSRRGGVSAVAAGLIGALIALIGAGALQYAGVLPAIGTVGSDETQVAELRSQVEALRDEIAAAGDTQAADPGRVDELASSLDQIRSQIAELQAAGPASDGTDTQALQSRLEELESTVASLQGSEPGASAEEIAGIGDQVDAFSARIDSLESNVASASDAATTAQEGVSGVQERLASLEARLQDLADKVEANASDPGAALAIAAAGLKSAIDRGDPFMTELETFAAVAPDAPEVAALRELAATGVPTRAALAARVDEVAARMIAAADPVDAGAGYFERLVDSIGSLVTVRPIGEVEGEGVGPSVARMEAAVEAGSYERAIAEYETLPGSVRAAGADFIADLRARQSADDLVAKALAGALRA